MVLGAAALLLLGGCLSPRREITQRLPQVASRWESDVARQAHRPDRTLTWPQAVALLETNNLKLRSARFNITNAQELATQPYRDLIPTINLRSGLTRSLKNIPSTGFDDITFNIDSFFNIPGVVNFDARLFAGRLAVLRALAAYQLTRREQVIELYKLFLEVREKQEIADELQSERAVADALGRADELAGQLMAREVETQQLALAQANEALQTRISEIFADLRYHWILSTNNLPDFDYETHPLQLADTNRVAQLQMKLVAIELVRAWAQIHGIKLQYLPELTIFVSGPSVYQRVNGENHFWSSADILASANLFWNIDTRGYVAMQLRQTRREQDLELARLRQDSQELIDRLLSAQRLAGSLNDQLRQLDRLIELLDNIPRDLDLNDILQNSANNRTLKLQRFKLRHDLAEVNSLFWFVDEQKWAEGK